MTLAEFADVFAVLAVQLRDRDADRVTIEAYYEAMKDLEVEFVRWAAERFASKGDGWFPKAPDWRAAAMKVEADRTEEVKARLRKRAEPLCLACGDTGWERDAKLDAVKRCACASIRRLEVLGRRPMPALTEGAARTVAVDADAVAKSLAVHAVIR
jgi:hypothetical protein